MTKILALVDGSIYAESVCDHAAWVARGLGLPVSVLHVAGRREPALPLGLRNGHRAEAAAVAEAEAAPADPACQRGNAMLDAARARLERAGVTTVATSLRKGSFVDIFGEVATGATLGVIGKRGEAADFERGELGSNLERAVRASPVPLLVASRSFRPVRRLVVAFDGNASAAKGVEHISLNPLFDECAVTLLSVGLLDAEGIRAREGALRILVAHGHSPEALELSGDPAAAIVEHVEQAGADMLVMGAYSHSRIRNFVIGSTTTETLRACRVPALLFR